MNKPTRHEVQLAATATAGAAFGVLAYRLGVQNGLRIYSMTNDLIAHQMVTLSLQKSHPELVAAAVQETVAAINGVLKATS